MSDDSEADLRAELAQLRTERDEARAELDQLRAGRPPRHIPRRLLAGTLVVISCVAFLSGSIGIWASRSFLDTAVWVDHVGPLADDPDVQEALSNRMTTELMQVVDPETLFEEVLPERGQLLAGPLSGAVEGFVGDQVDEFVASDAFANLWVGINRQAHQAAVNVLKGDSEVVDAGDETVTLNLVPVINQVLARITSASPELFGRTVDIPDVQIDEVPSSAIDKVNDAFGTDLPDDFGQITIYDGGTLQEVQDAVALFDRIVWVSVVVFVLATIGAFTASVDRRRTFYQLAIPAVLILVLFRRAAVRAQDQVLDLVPADGNASAVEAVTDALLQGLFDGTRIILWALVAVAAIVWVTGPTARAKAAREHTATAASAVSGAARERTSDPATLAWLTAHRDALMAAGVVVTVLVLVWFSLSWLGILVLLALLAAYEIALNRLGRPTGEPSEESSAGIT